MLSNIKKKELPQIRGKYREGYNLSKTTWFGVGGKAEILFRPADIADLSYFLKNKQDNLPVTVLGVGSNLLVRDDGIEGVVIKLGREFTNIHVEGENITCGAGALSYNVAKFAQQNSIGGLEFLSGIPGTIGGALAMNAGCYGIETSDIFVEAQAIDLQGKIHNLTKDKMGFSYRKNTVPNSWIFTNTVLKGQRKDSNKILENMNDIAEKRENTQPIRANTGGSTFKNPKGDKKAWQLIDEAGCRGLAIGAAKVSEKHCNFLTNTGNASASDLELLGEEVRKRVKENSGVELEWEIQRVGG